MKSIREAIFKFAKQLVAPPKDRANRPHSAYALMENGSMRKGSIGIDIFKRLMLAYNTEYKDNADKELIKAAIAANYDIETHAAWSAFLAEIGDDGDG